MSDESTESVEMRYGLAVHREHGQAVIHAPRESYFELMSTAKADGFAMCIDVTAVDYLTHPRSLSVDGVHFERFEVVVNLLSLVNKERLRIRVQLPAHDSSIASLVSLYPGAENMEREAFDLLGIEFTNHPDLTRILTPEDWEGHPLRKDYAQGRIPVQFKHVNASR